MRYLPHTAAEIEAMLKRIGVRSIDALFESIPAANRLNTPLALEPALDEPALMDHLNALAGKNSASNALSFLGAGMYAHHIPPAVDQLLLRSEFYTAYTPYQPEISQGTLQATFEFQTMVCELFGLEVANASMYDGASAAAEAILMARRVTGRAHCVLSEGVHPEYIETVRTYLSGLDDGKPHVDIAPLGKDGRTDTEALRRLIRPDTAAVLVGHPNFLGCVEDVRKIAALANERGAELVTATWEPYALSVIEAPGHLGADIATGEGQALAVPPQFGGPGVGLFACRQAHIRQMPGRLVGETVDQNGTRGYVLTLSTREQHIRREKATSNICTNHALIALSFAMRTAMLGKSGFDQTGRACLRAAEELKRRLVKSGRFTLPTTAPTFNEFVARSTHTDAVTLLDRAASRGVIGGFALSRYFPDRPRDILIAVTERHLSADLDRLVGALA